MFEIRSDIPGVEPPAFAHDANVKHKLAFGMTHASRRIKEESREFTRYFLARALRPLILTCLVSHWYHNGMPRKIKQLIKDLENAGFINRGGKGSHRNYFHPSGVNITISGKLGDDAKHYQEKEVEVKIKRSKK